MILRWLAAFFIVLTLALAAGPGARADALTGRGNSQDTSEGGGIPGLGGITMRLANIQRGLNAQISNAFHEVQEGDSGAALVFILALSFLYGALHAIGPGHGKSVVASYFMAHHARWTSGIVMGSMISVIQGVTAIILVGILSIILRWKQFDILNRTTLVEFVSYGLIVVIGAVMLYRAATGRLHHDHFAADGAAHDHGHDHDHPHHHHDPKPAKLNTKLIIATGLTPCASAIIILLFALANDALGIGMIAVVALTVGMALTISLIGVLTVLGRRAVLALVDKVGVESHRLEEKLAIIGALVIIGVSGLMMYGAWLRL
jgi:nickel/cobalt transporter (NicO) family protein